MSGNAKKRSNENENDDSESDDDFGPMPPSANDEDTKETLTTDSVRTLKKKRTLKFEAIYIDQLPSSDVYEFSYMHRDIVTHIVVSKPAEFIITGSIDGHIKFWKKMQNNIEFVKHFQAHLGPIHAFLLSPDGLKLVTTSQDKMIKFFDVQGFDMSNMISVDYTPTEATWLGNGTGLYVTVAVADQSSANIRVYQAEGLQTVIREISLHTSPVKCLGLVVGAGVVVSVDSRGVIEYWSQLSGEFPSDKVVFKYKTETDLYDIAKTRTVPVSLTVSPRGDSFAVASQDRIIRLFDFFSGKLRRKYDESISAYQNGKLVLPGQSAAGGSIDQLELGRRLATERELVATTDLTGVGNIVFDESGNFLIYGTAIGIKILNTVTNKVVRCLGTAESGERFLTLALYQGVPKVDVQLLLSRQSQPSTSGQAGGSKNVVGSSGDVRTTEEMQSKANETDPTIFCTSFKRRRFYCFSKRGPDESVTSRDVLNEMPTEEERVGVAVTPGTGLAKEVVLRTTMGDIHVRLFSAECPKTVENFTTHARNGYYDGLVFHRVIKGFMIQTGDPLGDGTGGESIWGGEFEDEFVRTLRHDRPFTVSMANCGPNTNGSQFFITTVPTPWLDNKHTVFGRVTKGFEVCTAIENARVNKHDKPLDADLKVLTVEVT